MSAFTPDKNEEYINVNYWNTRYEKEDTNDWLLPYESYRQLLHRHVKKSDKILMIGCGNSLLGEQLYEEGFTDIHNIDYSEVVISRMSSHCKICSNMKWYVMNAVDLKFDDCLFDVVIEKATIDSLLVEEKNPWSLSCKAKDLVHGVLSETSRVLKTGGHFISITFGQPHFRGPLYADARYNWSLENFKFGTNFHYFFYVMIKGQKLLPGSFTVYTPPVCPNRPNSVRETENTENDSEDYLMKIDCI